MSFNLATMLHESALATPDKVMIRFAGQELTYGTVDALSDRVAVGLRRAGIGRGDVVAAQLPNLPQFPVVYFGVLKSGATFLPLNPLLKAPEISYHLRDSAARLLIGFAGMIDEAGKSVADVGVPLYGVTFPGLDLPEGVLPYEGLLAEAPSSDGVIEPTAAEDTAVLVYTSGTTGRPKGAELTHFQLYMNCTVAGQLFEFQDDDVALAVLPFFHVFGLSSVLNLAVRYGGILSVVPRFEPKAVLDAIESDRVTIILGVPTMLQALAAEDLTGRDLSRLRVAVSGGASLPGEILRQFEELFGIVVLEGYGLSETASTATFNRSATERRVLSIGKPIWGVEMRIIDQDNHTLPAGADSVGEIVIRGHNLMKGYLGRPEATAEAFRDGWFHTGDLGYVDDDGFFFVVDRSKDLIIRGGYNVYPREVEEVLFEHPDITEVAVIGKPDDRLGEEVVAVVALRDGATLAEADVIAYAKERMAAYKYPREVRFIDHLPLGPTGKVLKTELR
jgi:long-chain acyl-CoA synthetase